MLTTERDRNNTLMKLEQWGQGIPDEAAWWRLQFSRNRKNYNHLLSGAPLPQVKIPEILQFCRPGAKVLDVGAGPISPVGVALPCGGKIDLTACDPLAPIYNALLASHEMLPYVNTEQAFAECLSETYPEGFFDIITVRNALDHSVDLLAGIYQLLFLVKVGGILRLEHHDNVGKNGNYEGLHQWNFYASEGDLFCASASGETINVSTTFSEYADVTVYKTVTEYNNWNLSSNVAVFQKKKMLPPSRDSFLTLERMKDIVETSYQRLVASGKLSPSVPGCTALIFGTRKIRGILNDYLNHEDMEIVGYVEDKPDRPDIFINSRLVMSLAEALEYEHDFFLIAARDNGGLLDRLVAEGVDRKKIFSLDILRESEQWLRRCPDVDFQHFDVAGFLRDIGADARMEKVLDVIRFLQCMKKRHL